MAIDHALESLRNAVAEIVHTAASTSKLTEREILLPHPFSNLTRQEWTDSILLWRRHGLPLLANLPTRPCPACGSETASDWLFDSYDGYPYHECEVCGTWFVPLQISHQLYEDYFKIAPQARKFGDYTERQSIDESAQASDIERFKSYYQALSACLADKDKNTLDIGCGVANSLAVAETEGFIASGLEVNANAVAIARKLDRKVYFPNEVVVPTGGFNCVTLWETLEHMHDPVKELNTVDRLLAKDGILAITVPNLNSPSIRLMRGDSLQIHGGPAWPGHINLFNPQTLSLLLERAGYRPFHTSGQYSMNLPEVLAHSLGAWSGARDYRRPASPNFVLPEIADDMLQQASSCVQYWEQRFTFAPIMRVFACRIDDQVPANAIKWHGNWLSETSKEFATSHNLATREPEFKARGTALHLGDYDYLSSSSRIDPTGRLLVGGEDEQQFGYLWRATNKVLPAGASYRVRGRLFSGGLSIGLLRNDEWDTSIEQKATGVFEVTLPTQSPGPIALVVANNDPAHEGTIADIDVIELILPK